MLSDAATMSETEFIDTYGVGSHDVWLMIRLMAELSGLSLA